MLLWMIYGETSIANPQAMIRLILSKRIIGLTLYLTNTYLDKF